MSDFAKKWPVAVNAAAGLVLAGFIGWQLIGGGAEEAVPVADIPAAEEAGLPVPAPAEKAEGAAGVDLERIANADKEPGNWLAHGRTYSEQRFSPLDQITPENIGELSLAWSLDTDTTRGLEATPIVIDGTMYMSLSWGVTIAVDAKSGEELWRFDPEVPGEWGRYGCCDVVNRGVAVWKGRVYVASFDGRLFALDAKDGSIVWQVNTIPGAPYTVTGAPRVFNDKVVIGNGGGEYGVRGFITAYDTETGEQAWRFYTVPGDPSLPIENPELEAAMPTWKGGEWWKIGGGGTAWDSMVYEPESNTLYVGTGNGSPWTREIRSPGGGDNLYLSSILALDADTGRMK
ncbi:MAG: PQQ-dependent dehydrogenase, methanol/ethanol family, partial [Alphaproteobacteria bacterium HGW-Alphaproteobacteria-3]